MSEIVLDDVTKRFGDGYEAVKHMSLDINDGEFVVIVGPSGCGKTTFLNMVAGLQGFSSGQLHVVGEPPLPPDRLGIRGSINLLLIAAIIGVILVCAQWRPGVSPGSAFPACWTAARWAPPWN